jgi:cell shape-determining protein MreC
MNSRQDSARRSKRRNILFSIFALVVLVFLLRSFLFPGLSGASMYLARPVWGAQSVVGGWWDDIATLFRGKALLEAENAQLHDKLTAITLESYTRNLLQEENEELKRMLGRPREDDLLLAVVLARPDRSPYDTFVVDVGTDAGIVPGMKVLADGDLMLGEVAAVHAKTSLVRLYSSSGTEFPVFIGSSTPLEAVARGVGGGNFRVSLPRGTPVREGDVITSPALGPSFAGVVDHIDAPESVTFATVYFKLPINWNSLRRLYIAIPRNGEMH